ncbi:conserved hypothetical protein [uncultured Desulfatiglans sp.]|nr:conserved hypothetical protein [uncultured Desulfatiglans sp.]
MVFFVLLFTMSQLDVKKAKTFQDALQSGLGVLMPGESAQVAVMDESGSFGLSPELNEGKRAHLGERPEDHSDAGNRLLGTVQEIVNTSLSDLGEDPGVLATLTDEGVVILLEDAVLFDSGKAEINSQAFNQLDAIQNIIISVHNRVRIEGHTDDVPICTPRFPSNWELSTARAVNVLKYFTASGLVDPGRFSAVGYADSKPLVPNESPEARRKNRRVEIVLVK